MMYLDTKVLEILSLLVSRVFWSSEGTARLHPDLRLERLGAISSSERSDSSSPLNAQSRACLQNVWILTWQRFQSPTHYQSARILTF